jgi:hypothetical protein
MGVLKRLAFYIGLLLGLITVAAAGTVALTYLFTGKLPGVEFAGEKPKVTLLTPDEVAEMVRAQVEKARTTESLAEGGAGDES